MEQQLAGTAPAAQLLPLHSARGAGQESVLPEGCSLPNDPGSQPPTPCPGGVNESRVCPAFFQLISLFRGALCLSGWHSDVQELSTTCEDVTSLTAACNY